MNAITIDTNVYQNAERYAIRHNLSVKDVVERGLILLFSRTEKETVVLPKRKEVDMDKAMDYVKSLSAKGGKPVPADENGIEALIEEKYLL